MQKNKFIFIIFFVTIFVKQIIWIALIPMWQMPDEQAHFAEVQNIAEKNVSTKFNTSKEIEISEEFLGVKRDINGNNKFTYHPEYNIRYSGSTTGINEKIINNIPLQERKNLVFTEATGYPPFYYIFAGIGYKIVYFAGLIDRVFFVRLWQSIIYILTIFIYYKMAKELIKEKKTILYFLIFISFLPMTTFVASGITSDNLMNMLFPVGLYLGIITLKYGIKLKNIIYLFGLITCGILTKPHFVIIVPIFFLAIVLRCFYEKKLFKLFVLSFFSILTIPILFIIFYPSLWKDFLHTRNFSTLFPEIGVVQNNTEKINFGKYLIISLQKTYRETIPWFWGVFRWLSFSLGRWFYRILNLVCLLSLISFIIKFLINIIKKREIIDFKMMFLLFSVLIYFVVLLVWDYLFFLRYGYSFGIQGRYYFPILFPIIFLIFYYFPFKKILPFLAIIFSFYAIFKVSSSYYSTASISGFIIQASQYKPWFFKGNFLVFWISIYLFMSAFFLVKLIKWKK